MANTKAAHPNESNASVLKSWSDLVDDLTTLREAIAALGDEGADAVLAASPQKTVK